VAVPADPALPEEVTAQEFVPTDEPLRALEEAFRICDV